MLSRRLARLCLILSLALLAAGFAVPIATQASDPPAMADGETWRNFASQAEQRIDSPFVSDEELSALRAELVTFRSGFLSAQDVNAARIATARDQIAALGPPPEDGATEAEEVASRRAELSEQLSQLQAPGIAAQEAFRRADGLIRQIDTIQRERQAEAILALWPSPINPVNWVAAVDAIWGTSFTFGTQVIGATEDPASLLEFRSNLPVSILLVLISGLVLWRGRREIERMVSRLLDDSGSRRSKRVLAYLLSLTQIIVPVTALLALATAIELTSLFGTIGSQLTTAMVWGGAAYFFARWAGRQAFHLGDSARGLLNLPSARRREGRLWSNLIGAGVGTSILVEAFLPQDAQSDAANAVIAFPILAVLGLVMTRLGMLLVAHFRNVTAAETELRFFDRMVALLGKAMMVVGIGAPLFAAVGYVQAAQLLLYSSIGSIGLIVVLLFLMQLDEDIYGVFFDRENHAADGALIPSLINFGLVIVSLPAFAIIWGVRPTELLEVWQTLREGFRIGDTRISPTNILSFIVIFSIGYIATRAVQGALGSSLLPKTKIDKGGQKAIISGTGYVGIFLAALIAISTAGIDLSGLAIVAGALSVGIGFGLQNIVSNFISGLILLIERPVAEGDWIEVGGTMGTVRSISVRSTVIETFDRTDVIVPNADLIQGTVTNWTRYNSLGRISIPVGVAYGSDTRKVARILKEIGENEPLALIDPAPQVLFMDFGADALEFELRMVLSDVSFGMAVRTELRHQITERFRQEGIEIPFAQRDVWLRNPEVLRGEPAKPTTPPQFEEGERTEMVRDEVVDTADGSYSDDGDR
ncbi:MAG: DUF3772 domain-containing protein [Roseinatronobacter sp.]